MHVMPDREPGKPLRFGREEPKERKIDAWERKLAGTWSHATAPDEDGRFFFSQKTLDAKEGSVKGFVSYRQYTKKPEYRELGRVLVMGRWSASDGELTIDIRTLPDHPELYGARKWKVGKVSETELNLIPQTKTDGDKQSDPLVLKLGEVGNDPNRVGSDEVQFHKQRLPMLPW